MVGIEPMGKICAKRAYAAIGHKYNINIYKYIQNSAFSCAGGKLNWMQILLHAPKNFQLLLCVN